MQSRVTLDSSVTPVPATFASIPGQPTFLPSLPAAVGPLPALLPTMATVLDNGAVPVASLPMQVTTPMNSPTYSYQTTVSITHTLTVSDGSPAIAPMGSPPISPAVMLSPPRSSVRMDEFGNTHITISPVPLPAVLMQAPVAAVVTPAITVAEMKESLFASEKEFKDAYNNALMDSRNVVRNALKLFVHRPEVKKSGRGVYACRVNLDDTWKIRIELSNISSSRKTRVILFDQVRQEKLVSLEIDPFNKMRAISHLTSRSSCSHSELVKLVGRFKEIFFIEWSGNFVDKKAKAKSQANTKKTHVKVEAKPQVNTQKTQIKAEAKAQTNTNGKRSRSDIALGRSRVGGRFVKKETDEVQQPQPKQPRQENSLSVSAPAPVLPTLEMAPVVAPVFSFAPVTSGKGKGKGKGAAAKGRTPHNPLPVDEFFLLVEQNKKKPFEERMAAVFQHAMPTKITDAVTWRCAQPAVLRNKDTGEVRVRSIRFTHRDSITARTVHLTQPIKTKKDEKNVALKLRFTAAGLFNMQESEKDTTCDSWIDERSDAKLITNTKLFYGNEKDYLIRHVNQIPDAGTAAHLDKVLKLEAGVPAVAETKETKDIAINDNNELHSINAHRELSGTMLYGFFNRGLRPLFQGPTKLVDDSKFTNKKDSFRVPLRVIFPIISGMTYYEKLDSENVFLLEGHTSTAFNGVLDQNSKRRAEKLAKLQNYLLSDWLVALQEQAKAEKCEKEDKELPVQLLDLVKKYFPERVPKSDSLDECKLTVKELVSAVYDVSKKAGGEATPDLRELSDLLCNGIHIKEYTGYSRKLVEGQKINDLRECVHELMWGSYLWEVKPFDPLAPAPAPAASSSSSSGLMRRR